MFESKRSSADTFCCRFANAVSAAFAVAPLTFIYRFLILRPTPLSNVNVPNDVFNDRQYADAPPIIVEYWFAVKSSQLLTVGYNFLMILFRL